MTDLADEFISAAKQRKLSDAINSNVVITDKNFLRMKSAIVSGVHEAKKILKLLECQLELHPTGVGLSAIQVGIPLQIAIIKFRDKKIELINPIIHEQFDSFINHSEGCLSCPGETYNTVRYRQITIDNCVIDGDAFRIQREVYNYDEVKDKNDIIAIAVQHEIDHMHGVLLENRGTKVVPLLTYPKTGRNEKCPCGSGIKYKKCHGK